MDRAEAIGALNFYRNRFYNEPLGTKERDLAEAINAVLPEYCALREQEQSKAKDNYAHTNADRIRAMTDEELAEWIGAVSPYEEYCGCCPAEGFCNTSYKEMECKDIVSLWLQQPCGGADHE